MINELLVVVFTLISYTENNKVVYNKLYNPNVDFLSWVGPWGVPL